MHSGVLSLYFVACFFAEQKFLFCLNSSVFISSLLGSHPEQDYLFQGLQVFVNCFLLVVHMFIFKSLRFLYFFNIGTIL